MRPAILTAILVLSVSASACAQPATTTPSASPAAREVAVKTARVTRSDVASTVAYTGEVRARSSLALVPKVPGRVEKLLVDVGASVKAGDTIAELDRDTFALTVKQAEAGLAAAKARLTQMKNGPRPDQVIQVEANARAARARSDSAAAGGRAEVISQAQAGLDATRQRLDGLKNPRAEVIGQADANLSAAQARFDALVIGPRPEQIESARIAIAQARESAAGAARARDGICGYGPSSPCEQARATAVQAQGAVYAAENGLAALTAPATAETLAQARSAVSAAREQAAIARQPTSYDIAQAENAIRAAEAGVALAQRPLASGDLEAADAQADAAEALLALTTSPFTKNDLDQAEAAVAQAQAALEMARSNLRETTITAPIDGVVADRTAVVGSIVSPATPIVTIVSRDIDVTFAVEESGLARVANGQAVSVAVIAFPGQAFDGKIAVISPTIDQRSRTSSVRVTPGESAMGKLRPGMFAEVRLILDKKTGVLAVPRAALRDGADPSVMGVKDGAAIRIPVKVGLRDAQSVEIVSGLDEGQEIIAEAVELREGDRVAVAAGR
ncbi:MAG: efflux RND transporter periplasmic adaptor subunit [Chloroflexota bacterium]|nr:MAG: efflux RND transporter periplasmic adaptor subunit [Chloroflexota bacterium]